MSSATISQPYPTTRRDEWVTENHFGRPIMDPYRWLENPDSDETQNWVNQQNDLTKSFIRSYPDWDKIYSKLTKVYNYPKYSSPKKRGNRYCFSKNDGLQNQSVLYIQDTLESEPRVFLDPNLLSEDGTASLSSTAFSESGNLYAYGVSKSGSDWQTIYIRDVETGKDMADKVEWVKFTSICWTHDDQGFFYGRYPTPKTSADKAGVEVDSNQNHMIWYHKVGTSQDEDVLVYKDEERPKYSVYTEVTDDGKYLIIYPKNGCKQENAVFYGELSTFDRSNGSMRITRLVDNENARYEYITNDGTLFYFMTNLNAPRKRVVCVDIADPYNRKWKEIIAETNDVLEFVTCVNHNYLIVNYLRDVKDILQLHRLNDGSFIKELALPGLGTVSDFSGKKTESEIFYKFISFVNPGTIYRYDFNTDVTTVFKEIVVPDFDPSLYNVEQVFYQSYDGTKVPMFIVTKKGWKLDGSQAMQLYGYGGFNVSINPTFSPFVTVMMNNLNVGFAIANIRGGGEYGKAWHEGGMKKNKQNVFDDFQAAAEYLINNKYTNPSKLIINGGSNGGLLVGACINQRPELFGCGVAAVGVMDMLRFHKFTIGHAWRSDYGDPDVEDDFNYIVKYSPLHNVRDDKPYPAMLLTTGDHDDRVSPLHSYKLISTLQHKLGDKPFQTNPLMIRIETKAGHGAGKPTAKIIEEKADVFAFMAKTVGLTWTD